MSGWIADPANAGWWYWAGSDVSQQKDWTQTPGSEPPDGYSPDPSNPGWYLADGSDPAQQSSWWKDETVVVAPQPAGLVLGIDVASYQPTDLTDLIAKATARHVVVRMYQATLEGASLQAHSRAQVASAQANGCTVGGYCWLYANSDPAQQVTEALALAQSCGLTLPLLWLDIEPYTNGSLPSTDEIRAALAACQAAGVRGGIYSGAWVWPRLGNPSFPGVPLWYATYDGVPELNIAPFGDMVLLGKQYSDRAADGSSLDCDVFDAACI